jgi:hypothetical protein
MRSVTATALVVLPLAALVGCTPTPAEPVEETPSAPASVTPTEEPVALPEDALLSLTATATAENGAIVDLALVVHESLAWSDPAVTYLADLMTQTCDGSLENPVYEENLWTFTQIDYTATAVDGEWPVDSLPQLSPTDPEGGIAAAGSATDDENVDMAMPYCLRNKYLGTPGQGMIALGIPGDTDEVTAAGNFTRWANTSYGFSVFDTPGSVTLSDCTYEVTPLGLEHNGDNDSWELIDTSTVCTVGTPFTGAD